MIDFISLMDPKILKIEKSDSYFEDSDWIQELKYYGRRMQCLIRDDVFFAGRYGRNAKENISSFRWKLFKIYEDLKKMKLPNNTLLDGEVYLPGKSATLTHQILNSDVDMAVNLQERHGFLSFVVFDIIGCNDVLMQQLTLMKRKQRLSEILRPTCNIELISYLTKTDEKRKQWQKILASTQEEKGVVFKFVESEYESNRSKMWRKMKSLETYDGVVIGFNLDEKYPKDFVTSIRVAQYQTGKLLHVADVSNLTREQAADFRGKIEFYLGKVVQFKSETKTATSYKNPRFDCLRLDKDPKTCLWED
ncbi:MAG: hypothetical protein Q7R33_03595 [Nitrosarchaeum sp.]|nr:hypothetical protein [Nitrosarchaeum sp.]